MRGTVRAQARAPPMTDWVRRGAYGCRGGQGRSDFEVRPDVPRGAGLWRDATQPTIRHSLPGSIN